MKPIMNSTSLDQARTTPDVSFVDVTIRISDQLQDLVESIAPYYSMDGVYAALIATGLRHRDEIAHVGDISRINLPEKPITIFCKE